MILLCVCYKLMPFSLASACNVETGGRRGGGGDGRLCLHGDKGIQATYHSTTGRNGKSDDFKELRNGQPVPLLCRIKTA